jgi:hypothetical protein
MDMKKQLLAVQGYVELGMYDDAILELDQFPEEEREGEHITCLRLDIYNTAERWQEAAQVARDGVTK